MLASSRPLALVAFVTLLATVAHAAPSNDTQTKVWGYEWLDLFDEPAVTEGSLELRKLDGEVFALPSEPGQPILVVEVDPDEPWWTTEAEIGILVHHSRQTKVTYSSAETLKNYRQLLEHFNDGSVTVLPVFTQRAISDPQARLEAARAYAEQWDFPGTLYVTEPGELDAYLGTKIEPEEMSYLLNRYDMATDGTWGTVTAVLDAKGQIVYRKRGSFDTSALRLMLERARDPAFDAQARREFPELRAWEDYSITPDGLLYREGFEHYADDFDFQINPRWGFTYKNQTDLGHRGNLIRGEGVDGSTALYSNLRDYYLFNISADFTANSKKLPYRMVPSLSLPAPLEDGTLTFSFRQGPDDELATYRQFQAPSNPGIDEGFGITFWTSHYGTIDPFPGPETIVFDGDGSVMRHEVYSGKIAALAKKKGEATQYFMHASKTGRVFTDLVLSGDWHTVEIRCASGQQAEVFVDGQSIGHLRTSSITSVYFSSEQMKPGFYLDDVSVLYRGGDEALAQAHREAPWPRESELRPDAIKDDHISLVHIPGGTFQQGDPAQGIFAVLYTLSMPVREVTISPFYMGEYAITYGQYRRVWEWARKNGYELDSGDSGGEYWRTGGAPFIPDDDMNPDHPVRGVNVYNQHKWLNALSEMEGRTPAYYTNASLTEVYRQGEIDLENSYVKWDADGYRLPTVAEWQYAFLGGQTDKRWWGEEKNRPEIYGHTGHPNHRMFVDSGSVPPNPYGLYDLGFWYESTWDVSAPYSAAPADNPKGGSVEDGIETIDYIERNNVLVRAHEVGRGGKADAQHSKAPGRGLLGCFGYEGGDGFSSAHGPYAFKRADHIAMWSTTDGTFRAATSDPRHAGGSYAQGQPERVDYVPPRKVDVIVQDLPRSGELVTTRRIPAGTYSIGGERTQPMQMSAIYVDNTPSRDVQLDAFWVGETEITYDQFKAVRDWALQNGYTFTKDESWQKRYLMKGGREANANFARNNPGVEFRGAPSGDQPVNHVSWYDAVKWCNALSEMEGLDPVYFTDASRAKVYRSGEIDLTPECIDPAAKGYRLPTEAEWEAACRGGADTRYFFGDMADGDYLWYHLNLPADGSSSSRNYMEVGLKKPNQFGLYDTAGNVFEWCFDWLGPYEATATDNPMGVDKATSARVHQALVDARARDVGPVAYVPDADPVEGEFAADLAARQAYVKIRRANSDRHHQQPYPAEWVFRRAKRVQRGGATWGSAKRYGADPLWTRHDQGFRVVRSD